jgi:hypothetical protein
LQPYADDASVYSYDWRVQDHYSGQDFGQGEVRQGYATDGEYQVTLSEIVCSSSSNKLEC